VDIFPKQSHSTECVFILPIVYLAGILVFSTSLPEKKVCHSLGSKDGPRATNAKLCGRPRKDHDKSKKLKQQPDVNGKCQILF
jgi:hypothetical protein